ncbi:MAG: hypothetical protein ACI943_001873, partial [Gammaproteobacteria bacterium]
RTQFRPNPIGHYLNCPAGYILNHLPIGSFFIIPNDRKLIKKRVFFVIEYADGKS